MENNRFIPELIRQRLSKLLSIVTISSLITSIALASKDVDETVVKDVNSLCRSQLTGGFSLDHYKANRDVLKLPHTEMNYFSVANNRNLQPQKLTRWRVMDQKIQIPVPRFSLPPLISAQVQLVLAADLLDPQLMYSYIIDPKMGILEVQNVRRMSDSPETAHLLMLDVRQVARNWVSHPNINYRFSKTINASDTILVSRNSQKSDLFPILAQLTRDHTNTAWRSILDGIERMAKGPRVGIYAQMYEVFKSVAESQSVDITPPQLLSSIQEALRAETLVTANWRTFVNMLIIELDRLLGIDLVQFSALDRLHGGQQYLNDIFRSDKNPLEKGVYALEIAKYFNIWLLLRGKSLFVDSPEATVAEPPSRTIHEIPDGDLVETFTLVKFQKGGFGFGRLGEKPDWTRRFVQPAYPSEYSTEIHMGLDFSGDVAEWFTAMTRDKSLGTTIRKIPGAFKKKYLLNGEVIDYSVAVGRPKWLVIRGPYLNKYLHTWLRILAVEKGYEDVIWHDESLTPK